MPKLRGSSLEFESTVDERNMEEILHHQRLVESLSVMGSTTYQLVLRISLAHPQYEKDMFFEDSKFSKLLRSGRFPNPWSSKQSKSRPRWRFLERSHVVVDVRLDGDG